MGIQQAEVPTETQFVFTPGTEDDVILKLKIVVEEIQRLVG